MIRNLLQVQSKKTKNHPSCCCEKYTIDIHKRQQHRSSDTATCCTDTDTSSSSMSSNDSASSLLLSPTPIATPKSTLKRVVSFDKISVRGYGIALGDNPSCSRGPALTLNWEYDDEVKDISVDEYEKIRCNTRRSKHEMLVPCVVRETIVRENGYSRSDIKEAEKESQKIQKSRYKNSLPQTKRQERTAELLESTRKVFVRRGSKDSLMPTMKKNDSGSKLLLKSSRKAASMNDMFVSTTSLSSSMNASWPTKGILKV